MNRKRTISCVALFLVGLLVPACFAVIEDAGPNGAGAGAADVTVQALSSADIAEVRITVSGPGISPPIVQTLSGSAATGWSGTIDGIPAGADRELLAEAFDGSPTPVLIYQGVAASVTIVEGSAALVTIFVQQTTAPTPFSNAAPRITGLAVSAYNVVPSGTASISVTASDPDLEPLTYQWSATGGAFDDAAIANPVWTAPDTGGFETLTIDVADPSGATATLDIGIAVASAPSQRFPLEVAPNGRLLLDPSGMPFVVNGDSSWSLMVALTDAEVTQYLDDRQGRGFNTILVNLIEHHFAPNPPRDIYGVAPFSTPEDIRTPNDTYFDRCVGIVQQALDRDLLVMMTPAYLGIGGGDEGWWQALAARTTSEVEAYGAYVGSKFALFPNVIWVMGGDYYGSQVLSRTRALVTGLKSTGRADWLFTYHAGPGTSATDAVGGEAWLNVNAIYTYNDLVGAFEGAYGRSPAMPFFLFEARYEQEPDPPVSRLTLRTQAYWSIVTGGIGALFGNNPIWNFQNNALFSYSGTWESNLNSIGAQDRTRFVRFFEAYDWSTLEPDRTGTVLIGGQSNGADSAYAAKSHDSSLVIVYIPSERQVTIDMTELSAANVQASWFRPTSAEYTTIGTFSNTGALSFSPPAAGDWVLVLEIIAGASQLVTSGVP